MTWCPRDSRNKQIMEARDINQKIFLILSGPPFTEFKDGRKIKPWEWNEFTQFDLHRGAKSTQHQWRLFARVAPIQLLKPAPSNKWIRRHCQVYLDAANFQW